MINGISNSQRKGHMTMAMLASYDGHFGDNCDPSR